MRHRSYFSALSRNLLLLTSSLGAIFLFEVLQNLSPRVEGEEAREELGKFASLVYELQDEAHY